MTSYREEISTRLASEIIGTPIPMGYTAFMENLFEELMVIVYDLDGEEWKVHAVDGSEQLTKEERFGLLEGSETFTVEENLDVDPVPKFPLILSVVMIGLLLSCVGGIFFILHLLGVWA